MADKSKIEWTEATWNPIRARNLATGGVGHFCVHASPGCANCYAERMQPRFGNAVRFAAQDADKVEMFLDEDVLTQPIRWEKPRMIFVCSMTDAFGDFVPDEWLDRLFAVMALCPQHTFQVLTKRSGRMREYMSGVGGDRDAEIIRTTSAVNDVFRAAGHRGNWGKCGSTSTAITPIGRGTGAREYGMLRRLPDGGVERFYWQDGRETWFRCADEYAANVPPWGAHPSEFGWGLKEWPLPNVWLGVSVEDQRRADQRIPDLLATPAAVRWISAEPLLGPVDLTAPLYRGEGGVTMQGFLRNKNEPDDFHYWAVKLDWVVVGGESGPKARPMHPDWARSLRDQCAAADVPFFFKQWGEWAPDNDTPTHWVNVHGQDTPPRPLGNGVWGTDAGMRKMGKKEAGRLLDGALHDAMPDRGEDTGKRDCASAGASARSGENSTEERAADAARTAQ